MRKNQSTEDKSLSSALELVDLHMNSLCLSLAYLHTPKCKWKVRLGSWPLFVWFVHSKVGFAYADVVWRISTNGNLRPLFQNVLTLNHQIVQLFSEECPYKIR